eukprot:TRINITY_DN24062_c0_g2_i1.p1 TRINITY_DN24062_c0_g2~~TRINITY_DN24062_c0_g2_i1.p1  ORF type:complete len:397 (+),score=69.45 TRINITY_DN24062_c0_g2_i1:43-1191(+)
MASPRSSADSPGIGEIKSAVKLPISVAQGGVSEGAAVEGVAGIIVQWMFLLIFRSATATSAAFQTATGCFVAEKDRAPRRLDLPRWLSVKKDRLVGLEKLPKAPKLPSSFSEEEFSLAFAGCANLMIYMAGVTYALQQAPGSDSVKWRLHGGSSGALLASAFALGLDSSKFLLKCHKRFVEQRCRFGGCLGVYSQEIRGILESSIAEERAAGRDPLAQANGRLEVSVTYFDPTPQHTIVREFKSDRNLIDVVLASCYIPVAYEDPIVLPGLGFCIDGCALNFLPNANCVISPWHCQEGDITPKEEYPGTLVFNLIHGEDLLRLFEDGYLDCVRWLEDGAPSKASFRDTHLRGKRTSIFALVTQFGKTFASLLGCARRSNLKN